MTGEFCVYLGCLTDPDHHEWDAVGLRYVSVCPKHKGIMSAVLAVCGE